MNSQHRRITHRTRLLVDEALDAVRRGFVSDDSGHRPVELRQLEQRLLMSATPAAVITDAPDAATTTADAANPDDVFDTPVSNSDAETATDENVSGPTTNTESDVQATVELVVIDPSATDYEQLVADLQSQTDRALEILVLNPRQDGISQITDALQNRTGVSAIHLVSHGDDGEILLGTSVLSQRNIDRYAAELVTWQHSLTADADLLIYGCDLTASDNGIELTESLNVLLGTDVAASDDKTGHAVFGGDWILEYSTGVIDTSVAFSSNLQANWNALLLLDTFQQGAGGYSSAQDTNLDFLNPDADLGTGTSISVQTGVFDGLIRFGDLIGDGPGQISVGSTINSVSLTVEVTDASLASASIQLHRMLAAWDQTSTWNSLTGGIQTDDVEAAAIADSILGSPNATGSQTFTGAGLAATVQAWVDGNENLGWAITSDKNNTWVIASSDDPIVAIRPQLTVDYTPPPVLVVDQTLDQVDGDVSSVSALLGNKGADGLISLREAVQATNNTAGFEVIWINAGTYTLSIDGAGEAFAGTGDLDIRDDVRIVGASSAATIIDGSGLMTADRVFDIQNGATVTFEQLTIQGGDGGGSGGGAVLVNTGTDLTAVNLVFDNNSGNNGGAIQNNGTFTANATVFSNNSANSGGGLDNSGTVTLTDVEFTGNNVGNAGGGLRNNGTADLNNVTFSGNTANSGAGIHNGGGLANLTLTNVTISGNTAVSSGGGIATNQLVPATNVTIAYNTVTSGAGTGGGVYVFGGGGDVDLKNSVLAYNTAAIGSNSNAALTTSGNNIVDDLTTILIPGPGDHTNTDPMLDPTLQNNGGFTSTHALTAASTDAIDGGTSSGAPALDQRGFARAGSHDIGAYEYNGFNPANDAPVNTVPGTQATPQDTSLEFSTTGGNLIAISDIDAAANSVEVTLTVTNGTVTLNMPTGVGTPTNPEQVVPTTTGQAQKEPAVARAANGNYVVAWSGKVSGDDPGIGYRVFDADHIVINEGRANTTTTDSQDEPSVAMDDAGNFVIVWTSGNQDSDATDGIYGQRFDAAGNPVGGEFQVHTTIADTQNQASVAMDAAGDFVVVWTDKVLDGNKEGIFGQRFSSSGTKVGSQFQVNDIAVDTQQAPRIAMANGSFVVTWSDKVNDGDGYGIYARRFDASGSPLGNQFVVNTNTDKAQDNPDIAMDATGNFVIVWDSKHQNGTDQSVYGQMYDAAGDPVGSQFRVNTFATNNQRDPSVSMDADGDFVVVWESINQDNPGETDGPSFVTGVYAQQFDKTAAPVGGEILVNTTVIGSQQDPAVAMDANGNFVVVWQGEGVGDADGVFARRYDIPPSGLTFTTGDGSADSLLTFTGTITDINNVLDGIIFTPDPGFTGLATIDITTDDLGNTGTGGPLQDMDTVNVNVSSANSPPTITSDGGGPSAAVNATENSTAVTTVTATDADLPAQTLAYSISGGADQAKFDIDSSSGMLTFVTAPDFESPTDAGANNVYDVQVQVSDGLGGTDTQNIAVTVTNLFEGIIVVDTTADVLDGNVTSAQALLDNRGADGKISLREALAALNATANTGVPDEIHFNFANTDAGHLYYQDDATGGTLSNIAVTSMNDAAIPDFDPDHPYAAHSWFRIDLNNALPQLEITDAVVINGYTQAGSSQNTLTVGNDAVLRVELTNSAGDSNRGISVEAGGAGSSVLGLVINGFGGSGILTEPGADNVTIQGNFLGTDVTGTIDVGNSDAGVHLRSSGNLVGGANLIDRNVISGNQSRGVTTYTFGPIETGNVIQNNYIGTDATGVTALGNDGSAGVQIYNNDGLQLLDNVIVASAGEGVWLRNSSAVTNTVIKGNLIGVGADGTTVLGNSGHGIWIEENTSNTTIGGLPAGEGNTIANSGGDGISITNGSGTTIRGNAIYNNSGLGIDLNNNGVTSNDLDDLDGGPNSQQNFPVLTSADGNGTDLTIIGSLHSSPLSTFQVDFYSSSAADPSGYGEAQRYLGSATVSTDLLGNGSFNELLTSVSVAAGEFITATATDSSGNTSEFSQNIVATNANTSPAITSNGGGSTAAINIVENTTAGTTVTATDPEAPPQTLSYSISGGADQLLFNIDSGTGVLEFNSAPDFEAPTDAGADNVYDVQVQVSDGAGGTDTQSITVTVTDTNDNVPVITASQSFNVSEAAANGTALGTLTATDADAGTTFSGWTITAGNTDGIFAVNAATGQITVLDNSNLDFETTSAYVLSLTVSDGTNTSAAETVTVNLTNVAEVVLLDQFNAFSYDGNDGTQLFSDDWIEFGETTNPTGGRVRVVTSTSTNALRIGGDEVSINGRGFYREADLTGATSAKIEFDYRRQLLGDSGGSVTLEISNNDGATWNALKTWNLNGTDVGFVTDSFDISGYIAADTQIRFIGSGSDVESYFYVDNVEIQHTGIGNNLIRALADVDTTVDSIGENSANGTVVGITARAIDVNASDTVTYFLDDDAGGRFAINATSGVVTVANGSLLDFEATASHTITIRATSSDTSSSSKSFSISVNDLNDNTPLITASQSFNVSEAAANGTALGSVTATDADAGTTFSNWTITAGNTDGIFAINAATGQITVADNSNLDFETTTGYTLSLTVSDGTNTSATETVAVAVTAANDNSPVFTSSGSLVIPENTPNLVTLTATDADLPAQSISFSIVGGDDAALMHIAAGNHLMMAPPADFEMPLDADGDNVYEVQILADDGNGRTSVQFLSVTITDVNDNTPVVTGGQIFNVSEIAPNGTALGSVIATDADAGTTFSSWTITAGNADGIFAVNAATGALTVVDNTNLDIAVTSIYLLDITVSDGLNTSAARTVQVNVTPGPNTAPIAVPDSYTVSEGAILNVPAGSGVLNNDTDADGDPVTASLISGPVNAAGFTLNGDGSFSYQHNGSETTSDTFTYSVSDGTIAATTTVTLTVTPVNDNPTLTAFSNVTIPEDTAFGPVAFTVADSETASTSLVVTATSSVQSLIADSAIVISGSGASRTLSFTPVADATGGPATITVSVSDGVNSTSTTFDVSIKAVHVTPSLPIAGPPVTEGSTQTNQTPASSNSQSDSSDSDNSSTLAIVAAAATPSSKDIDDDDAIPPPVQRNSNDHTAEFVPVAQIVGEVSADPVVLDQIVVAELDFDRVRASSLKSLAQHAAATVQHSITVDTTGNFPNSVHLTYQDFSELKETAGRIDEFQENLKSEYRLTDMTASTVAVAGTSIVIGTVVTALRTGMLALGFLSQLPVWTLFDPLLVMDGVSGGDDGDSLQDIIDRQVAAQQD